MAVFCIEKKKNYTVMSNHHLRNPELSLKAKGLLSLMLSLPDNWDYTEKGLAHICKEGVGAIESALWELEREGYLSRRRLRDEQGRVGDMEYTIHEVPMDDIEWGMPKEESADREAIEPENRNRETPVPENPILENPVLENPAQLNTNILNTYIQKTKRQNTDLLIYQSVIQSIHPGFHDTLDLT